jgi:hypothetical protein
MSEWETRAVCCNCESEDWDLKNVINTPRNEGILQMRCNDCGGHFEIHVKRSSIGWTYGDVRPDFNKKGTK